MFSKADIGRLKAMLRRLEQSEEYYQRRGLAVFPRSARACDLKDAATLRRVIAKAESTAPADGAPAQAASLYVEGMKRATKPLKPKTLPTWAPCNPACDPELHGLMSEHCCCEQAKAAMGGAAE